LYNICDARVFKKDTKNGTNLKTRILPPLMHVRRPDNQGKIPEK